MDEQEQPWIIITKTKNKKRNSDDRQKKIWSLTSAPLNSINPDFDVELILASESMKENRKIIQQIVKKVVNKAYLPTFIQLQCLGIGNFKKFKKPYNQYLFFKHILYPILLEVSKDIKMNIYDPIFDQDCLAEIRNQGAESREFFIQKSQLKNITLHLVSMVHCQRFLYQQVLQKFYEKYRQGYNNNVVIIGNSIRDYTQRCNLLKQPVPQIFQCFEYEQNKLKDYQQAFNDTYIYQLVPK